MSYLFHTYAVHAAVWSYDSREPQETAKYRHENREGTALTAVKA